MRYRIYDKKQGCYINKFGVTHVVFPDGRVHSVDWDGDPANYNGSDAGRFVVEREVDPDVFIGDVFNMQVQFKGFPTVFVVTEDLLSVLRRKTDGDEKLGNINENPGLMQLSDKG